MADKVTAYVLPREQTNSSAESVFAGIPGVWLPDVPLLERDLCAASGLSGDGLAAAIAAAAAPLVQIHVAAPKPPPEPKPQDATATSDSTEAASGEEV